VSFGAYLLAVALGGGGAAVCPQRFWLAPAGLLLGQAAAVWLLNPRDVMSVLGVTITASLVSAPAVLSSGLIGLFFGRRHHRPPPWACAACGYDLRGIDTERCPECGAIPAQRGARTGR
jgi:hypothetical protein